MINKFIFFIFFISSNLFANGGVDGGGGQVIVCYDKEVIKSVELLDIYEGKLLENLEFKNEDLKYREYLEKLINKTQFQKTQALLSKSLSIEKSFKFLPPKGRLRLITDADVIFIPEDNPEGCKIEQIANFQGFNRVFIVGDFWKLLSPMNKAALILHEYLWYIEREMGNKKSSRVRRTVARLFSSNFKPQYSLKPLNQKVIHCYTRPVRFHDGFELSHEEFLVNKNDRSEYQIDFLSHKGSIILTRKYSPLIYGLDFEDLLLNKNKNSESTSYFNIYTDMGQKISSEIQLNFRLPLTTIEVLRDQEFFNIIEKKSRILNCTSSDNN